MLKFLKWALILVVVFVLVVVIVGLFLPSKYDVQRSVVIDAPPEVVFKYLNDLDEWKKWEPFSQADDSQVVTIGKPSAGVGATQSWTGDSGDGTLTFTMADPDKGIAYDLDFTGYDPATSQMLIEEVDGKTKLTWTMAGEMTMPVAGGYFVLMMDSMVGPMYDNGLENIKKLAEADAAGGGDETPENGGGDEPPEDPDDGGNDTPDDGGQ